jgi:hypothetical protein
MNETTRTLTFVGVAVALAAAAFGMHAVNQPASLAEFSDVGAEFYPDFDNPRNATGLRVAAYNDEAARVDVFNVEFKNGLWRIPSHHDYPADGEERLANTATSIIGLQRGALVSTSADDHKRLGVLDPLDRDVTGTEGRGDRITLTKGDDVLADYIVGSRVEDGPPNTWHVRRADENRTYRVTLDLDISTKFADWIEPDLLDFRRGDVRELVVDRYSVDQTRGVVDPGTRSVLNRTSQDDPWKLDGIDEQAQQVKTSTVNQMLNALEDLKIVGVRRKPAGLSANLRGEGDGIDTRAVLDLEQKGFFLDARGALVSDEGDFQLATADGARYVLRFGEVFTGSDVEIEVGQSSPAETGEAGDDPGQETPPDGQQSDAEATDDADDNAADGESESATDSGSRRNRYVFITAEFDESLIESLPEKPVKPEPPADDDAPKAEEPEADETANEENVPADDDAAADDTKPEDDAANDEPGDEAAAEDKPDPKAQYEQALADYERRLNDWEVNQKSREARLEAGQKRVQELNNRFADWYYVISAETFDKIRVTPEELVEAVAPDADAADAEMTPPAGAALPVIEPADPDATVSDQPAADRPEADKPEADTPAADTPAADNEKPPADEPANNPDPSSQAPAEPSSASDPTDSPPADDSAANESSDDGS